MDRSEDYTNLIRTVVFILSILFVLFLIDYSWNNKTSDRIPYNAKAHTLIEKTDRDNLKYKPTYH